MNGMSVKAYSLKHNGDKKLSLNFKVREFACKDGSDVIFISLTLVDILQKVRTHFGKRVTVNSAFRTPSHDKSQGGATNSQHLYGLAADIVVSNTPPKAVAQYVETLLPNSGGIGIYKNFTHVDVRSTKSRWTN